MESFMKSVDSSTLFTFDIEGKYAIAARDITQGQEIVREFPLLYIGKDQENMPLSVNAEKKTGIHRRVWAVYFQFLVLSEEAKNQIRGLHSLTGGTKEQSFKELLNSSDLASSINVEEFLAITMIFNFNAIEERVEGSKNLRDGTGIYASSSRFAHSCTPNCVWYSVGDGWCTVRAIANIQAGETLGFNFYDNDFVCQPTNLRRAYLSRSKEIMCHCARCENPADDTRQFSCADKSCAGRHFVSQSTIADLPLMLPCTVCGVSLSSEAQKLLLYREKCLATAVKGVLEEIGQFPAKPPSGRPSMTPEEILALEFLSPAHYLTHYLAKCKQVVHEAGGNKPAAVEMATLALHSLDEVVRFPSLLSAEACLSLGECHEDIGSTASLQAALSVYQRALRLSVLVYGSADRKGRFQEPVTRVLTKLQTSAAAALVRSSECQLCGQIKDEAHLLRRCGGCKAVNYCGVHCQRAHWTLHSAHCQKK